mmetsp:Transcript_7889/g.17412  ORF Transcript_7889/g.17412 Transcript_7889/m.17412 type:complete len:265 (-) Transcript_7889:307-1101(-)
MGICSSAPEDPPFELSNEADGGMSPSTSIVPLTTETTSYTFGDFHVLLATQRKDIYSYNISSLDIKDGKGKIVYTITTTDSQKGTSLEFSVKDAPFFAFFKHQVLYMGILILKNAEGEKLALLKRQGTFRGLFPDRELSMPWDVYSYKQLRPGAKAHVFAEEKVYEVGGMTELLKGKEFQYTGEELSLRGRNGAKLKKYDLDSGPLKLNVSINGIGIATMRTDEAIHTKTVQMVKHVDPVQMLCFAIACELKVRKIFPDSFLFS